jgi:hypothetical protein
MAGENLLDDFIKDKFPIEECVSEAPKKVLDIYEFDDLIDAYKDAQNGGTVDECVAARKALKDAYRAALRAAGRSDR